jgi:tRNA G10  N-methylase Trm11
MASTETRKDHKYIKTSIHAVSPYVGKLRPELANRLVNEYSLCGDIVFDPFCGSGTVALEAWINNRIPLATDLNYYAYVLTKAKLDPYKTVGDAVLKFEEYSNLILRPGVSTNFDLSSVPGWVKEFFHPRTLQEITILSKLLLENKEWFLLACLMGILHHQRPGFLSYPSSHGAPYLRIQKFPKDIYPELYEYRNVHERMVKKIQRTYKYFPKLDFTIRREVYYCNTLDFNQQIKQNVTIITSPPYMKSLTYARDNRLRLWFLGCQNWAALDKQISVGKKEFLSLMTQCFNKWCNIQKQGNYCVLVIGDIIYDRKTLQRLPSLICNLAERNGYSVDSIKDYPINDDRKIEKKDSQIKTEKICILKRG